MSNINKTGCTLVSNVPQDPMIPHGTDVKRYVLSQIVDLTAEAIVQADVYQCLAIPADTLVESVHYETITPAVGTTLTENVGDGGSTAGWIGSTDGKAVAGTFDHSTYGTDARAVANNSGYFYDTADTIDVVMTTATAITAGPKFKIYAVCSDLN